MNELAVRGVLAYFVGSALIWFMRDSMIYNRAAYRGNPAWWLISSIYELFSWSWWILICLAAVAAAAFVISIGIEAYRNLRGAFCRPNKGEQALELIPMVHDPSRSPPPIVRPAEDVEAQERRAREKKEKEERAEQLRQAKLEAEKRRTPDEAVDLALDGFC